MPLTNCKISVDLNWCENFVIVSNNIAAQVTTFSVTEQNFMFQL